MPANILIRVISYPLTPTLYISAFNQFSLTIQNKIRKQHLQLYFKSYVCVF